MYYSFLLHIFTEDSSRHISQHIFQMCQMRDLSPTLFSHTILPSCFAVSRAGRQISSIFVFKGEDYHHVFRSSGRNTNWCALVLMMLLECTTCNVQRTAAVFTMAQKKKNLIRLIFCEVLMNSFLTVEKSSKIVC